MTISLIGGGTSIAFTSATGKVATVAMSNTKEIGAQIRATGQENIELFIQAGLSSDGATDAYILADKLDRKIAAGEVLSDTEIGKLVELVTNDAKAYRQAEIESQQKQEKQAQFRGKTSRFFSHGTETETTAPVNIPADGKNEMNYITQADGAWHTSETGPPSAFRRDSAKTAVAEAPRVGYNVRQTEAPGMLSFENAARGLGRNGARALSAYYNDGLSLNTDTATHPAAYANEFLRYYEAGKQGTSQNSIIPSGADPLTPAQKAAAYNAGMNDAAAGETGGTQRAEIGEVAQRYINKAVTAQNKFIDKGVEGYTNRFADGAEILIDGIKITDGKVDGKIPVYEFKKIRQSSIKNPDADTMTLGKFTDDANSYIQRAGKTHLTLIWVANGALLNKNMD